MTGTTIDILFVALFLGGMDLFGLAMLGVALKFGPRRGFWNQPAAMLRRPGRRMFVSMYSLAALHVATGIGIAITMPYGGVGVLVVLCAIAVFYVLCAHSWVIAHSVARRRSR